MKSQRTAKAPRAHRVSVAITAAVLFIDLAGCTVGPDYVRPEADVNPSWLESTPALQDEPAQIRDWWAVFDDPVLTRLVQEAYEQNLTLRAAGLRVIQARAARGIAVGEFFPQEQEIQADYSASESSLNDANNIPFPRPTFQTASLGFDAVWELDFWGKFRRNIYAADAALLGSIADYDDVLVTLVADVGLTYVQIRTLERRIELANANIRLQRQAFELTRTRYRDGKVSLLDVTEARATLLNTRSKVPDLESSLRNAKLSLGVLLGRTPSELEQELVGGSGIPTAPAQLAIGVPADLLRRRPDVRSAERVAAFQSQQTGIATADLFPSISIGGSFGFRGSDANGASLINNVLVPDSVVWSIGPTLSWPILNYGRIVNNIRVEDAAFQEAVVDYQNRVLQAAAEVESSLYGFLKAQEQLALLTESTENVRKSLKLSTIQYIEGETDFLRVDIAAVRLTQQQDRLATAKAMVASNLIGAYKALGGGWEQRLGNEFIPVEMAEEMRGRTDWGNILDTPDYAATTDLGFPRPANTDDTWLATKAETGTNRSRARKDRE